MKEPRRGAGAVVAASAALGLALALHPLPTERLVAIYVLALAAIALAALTRIVRPAFWDHDSAFERALAKRGAHPMRPPELVRTEREITLGIASAGHLERRLLPLLREAAAARLAAKHGVELARRPEAARALLGDAAWELLRPGRPDPEDRNAPGLPLAQVEALVTRLESL